MDVLNLFLLGSSIGQDIRQLDASPGGVANGAGAPWETPNGLERRHVAASVSSALNCGRHGVCFEFLLQIVYVQFNWPSQTWNIMVKCKIFLKRTVPSLFFHSLDEHTSVYFRYRQLCFPSPHTSRLQALNSILSTGRCIYLFHWPPWWRSYPQY